MIRLLTAALLFASFHAIAQTQVPNVFEDGTPASAAEVNENFDALGDAIDALPTPPSDCTTDQIIKWNGSAWECASRLSGAITMIDRWYTSTSEASNTLNIGFTQDGDSTLGVMRGDGNQMAFTAGTGSGHGFSFPETGIYRVDTTMSLRPSTNTSQSTYVRAQLSIDTAGNWSNIGYMGAWDSNFGIEGGGQVYMSVSMSFTLNISNTATDRLRFEFNEGNTYSSLRGGSSYSWVTFTRIEP